VAAFSLGRSTAPIGLDIGTNLFRAVQLVPGADKPVLQNFGSIKVPVGAVVEGEIVDIEAAAYALTHLWKSAGFSCKDVVIGVASQRVVVRLVTLPYMDQAELSGAIQFQAQDFIPIPVEEAIIDAQIIREVLGDNEERMMEVLLVAAQRDMINNTVAAVEQAGLRPQIIDLSAFAVVRSLLPEDEFVLPEVDEGSEAGSAVALINISAGLTNIVVVESGTPRFARVTPLAGNDLTQSIADSLGMTFEEAEELKTKVGLAPIDAPAEPLPEDLPENLRVHAEAAQNIMENQINHFIAEIRRSLDYYLTQATEIRNINRLILSGAGSKLKHFPAYLERGLQAKVELGNPLVPVKLNPHLTQSGITDDEMSLAIGIGLALRSFE
jgi:type IV pilus assembly protein PilM